MIERSRFVSIAVLVALPLALSCSRGSGSDYQRVQQSAETVRSKLESYTPQTIRPPAEVCGGETSAKGSGEWDASTFAGGQKLPADEASEGASPDAMDAMGAVEVTSTGSGWEVRSEGATMAGIVRALEAKTDGRIVVRGTGMNAPIYARARGESWGALLDELATSVGMRVVDADGVKLVADAAAAVHLQRRVAQRSGRLEPLDERFIQVEHPHQTASLLAEFALGCRGSILLLPDKDVMLVEDTARNLSSIEEWTAILDDSDSEIDRTYSRDRLERFGIAEPSVARCGNVVDEGPDEEDDTKTSGAMQPVGQLVLQRALDEGDDVIVGCGSHAMVASTPKAVPLTTLVQEYLGLDKIDEDIWVSTSHAERTKALRRQNALETTWRLVRHEPISPEMGLLLSHRHGEHFRTRSLGWGGQSLLSVRKGHWDQFQATVEEYEEIDED